MAKIADLLDHGTTVSFEFFPPRTERGTRNLTAAVDELQALDPSFVSVTYGAAGSTRDRTREIVLDLEKNTPLTPMPHLTCIAHQREQLEELLVDYDDAGLENLLALHGDPPRDRPDVPHGDLRRAAELVELAREVGEFSVGVATHPEGHPKAPDLDTDRRHQAAKLELAEFGITQFFFRTEDYLRLLDDLEVHGVDTPIIAGVMPITDVGRIQRFAELSGADVPPEVVARLEPVADDPEETLRVGVEIATELCADLLDAGAPGLHFYTLNRARASREIVANLGLDGGSPPAR